MELGTQISRIRRSLEQHLPQIEFDDEVVEYFANSLSSGETSSEENVVQDWAPFLISAGACKEDDEAIPICRAILNSLQTESVEESSEYVLPPDIVQWLDTLSLSHYAVPAHTYCETAKIADLQVLLQDLQRDLDPFADQLKLKPLEKLRIPKWIGLNSAAAQPASSSAPPRAKKTGTFGPPEDPERYTMMEEIGSGATARVNRCLRGVEPFAVKTIDLKRLRLQADFKRKSDMLHREVSILLCLQHPRIVTLFDVVEEPNTALCLVMELVKGGCLFNRILQTGHFTDNAACHIFVQLVEGLMYIHSKDIVHRDLKPENVLVDDRRSRGELLEVKLSDFGHSKLINDGYSTAISSRVGTPQYMAPEVSDTRRASQGYDQTADLWSLGVVLYVMLAGAYPFDGKKDPSYKTNKSGQKITESARDLIQALFKPQPNERLPLKRCFEHSWVVKSRPRTSSDEVKLPQTKEVRIPLPCQTKPSKELVRKLRTDLTEWQTKYCFSAAVIHQEIIVNYGDEAQVDKRKIEAARRQLDDILKQHFSTPVGGYPVGAR